MTTVKQLKEHLATLDEDAPIAYWLWQEKNVVAEINHQKNQCRETGDTEYEAKLGKLTDGDTEYILSRINECYDEHILYHAVNNVLDRVTSEEVV